MSRVSWEELLDEEQGTTSEPVAKAPARLDDVPELAELLAQRRELESTFQRLMGGAPAPAGEAKQDPRDAMRFAVPLQTPASRITARRQARAEENARAMQQRRIADAALARRAADADDQTRRTLLGERARERSRARAAMLAGPSLDKKRREPTMDLAAKLDDKRRNVGRDLSAKLQDKRGKVVESLSARLLEKRRKVDVGDPSVEQEKKARWVAPDRVTEPGTKIRAFVKERAAKLVEKRRRVVDDLTSKLDEKSRAFVDDVTEKLGEKASNVMDDRSAKLREKRGDSGVKPLTERSASSKRDAPRERSDRLQLPSVPSMPRLAGSTVTNLRDAKRDVERKVSKARSTLDTAKRMKKVLDDVDSFDIEDPEVAMDDDVRDKPKDSMDDLDERNQRARESQRARLAEEKALSARHDRSKTSKSDDRGR